jgi:molecular chaperone DnaK (HSP70)
VNETPIAYECAEKLIIALDFGTTYSGLAYCFPSQANARVATIKNWTGQYETL